MNLDNMQQEQEAEEEAKILNGGAPLLAKPGKDAKTPPRDEQGGDSSTLRKGSKRSARASSRKASKAKASSSREKAKPAAETSENFGFFAGGAVWDDPLFASYEAPVEEEPVNKIVENHDRVGSLKDVTSRENGVLADDFDEPSSALVDSEEERTKGRDIGSYEQDEEDGGDDNEGSIVSRSDSSGRSGVSKRYNFNEDFLKDISDCESEADVQEESKRFAKDDIYCDGEDEDDGVEGTPSKHKGEARSRSGSGVGTGGSDITSQIWSNLRGLYSSSTASSSSAHSQAPKQGDSSAPGAAATSALNQPVRPRFLFFDRVEEEVDLEDDPILKQVKKNASSGSYFDPSVMPKIFNDFLKPFKQPVAPKPSEAAAKATLGAGGKDIEMGSMHSGKSGYVESSGAGASSGSVGVKEVAMLIFAAGAALCGLIWRLLFPALGYLKALCSRLYLQISANVDNKGERISFQNRVQNIGWCTWSHISSKNGIGESSRSCISPG
jgi:hypothetical protein